MRRRSAAPAPPVIDQVMAPMDYEMAQLLHENIEQNGVKLALGDGVKAFEENEKGVGITLNSGKKLDADLVIDPLAILAGDRFLHFQEKIAEGIVIRYKRSFC